MNKKELKKNFPFLLPYQVNNAVMKKNSFVGYCGKWYSTERGILKALESLNNEQKELFSKRVRDLEIFVEWKKSSVWGNCPHATAYVTFEDGTREEFKTYASGCGYDKYSSVIGDVFNEYCRGMLYKKRNTRKKVPYGIALDTCSFMRGVGGESYTRSDGVAKFIGFKKISENRRAKHSDYLHFSM